MQNLNDGELAGTPAEAALLPTAARPARVRAGARRPLLRGALALGVFVALTAVVEVAVRLLHLAPYVFPPPSAVLAELAKEPRLFADNALVTVYEAFAGLALGGAMALIFAAAAIHSRVLDRVLTPLVVASQTVPVIALAPLLVLWFGYGVLPRVIICALIAFFPMAVTTLQGFRATDPQLLLLLRSVDARLWDVFWRVRMPAAAPFLAAGLRTGATLSLVGAVVAEWTGTDRGLGYLVLSANARLATSQAFAAVFTITVLGLAAYGAVVLLERKLCWWNLPDDSTNTKEGFA
ncbi:MAG: ABC transporter permease [Thermoleophilia bacterium]